MRIITCVALALFSAWSFAVVVDPNNSAITTTTLQNIDPADTPVYTISGNLTFAESNPLEPGERVQVIAFNSAGIEIGQSIFENTYLGSIINCACIDMELTTPLEDVTFSVGVKSIDGGIYDVTSTIVVQAWAAPADYENVTGFLTIGQVPPSNCVTTPTADGCPCPPGQIGDTYPSCEEPPPFEGDFGIVYTRMNSTEPLVPGEEATNTGLSNFDKITDVSSILQRQSPADIIYDDLKGNEIALTNCLDDLVSTTMCAGIDARVSPDGTKIIYAILTGYRSVSPVLRIQPGINSKLYVYDIPTKTTTALPWIEGTWDRYPDWINNDEIIFTSTRGGVFPPGYQWTDHRGLDQRGVARKSSNFGSGFTISGYNQYPSMHIWRSNLDGSNAVNLTPHEAMAYRPHVAPTGDIYYSCLGALGQKMMTGWTSHNGTSPTNHTWVCRMTQNGGDNTSVYNTHTGSLPGAFSISGVASGGNSLAMRGVNMDAEGWLTVADYYQSNHNGAGWVQAWKNTDVMVEGCSTTDCAGGSLKGQANFIPIDNFIQVTPYGMGQDQSTQRHSVTGQLLGKAGFPTTAPTGSGRLIITHGRGWCYSPSLPSPPTIAGNGGEPFCDWGIWMVKDADMSVYNPFDRAEMAPIIDDPNWHEFDADVVAPYSAMYPGMDMPLQQEPYTGTECYLNVVDATKNEIENKGAYAFSKNWQDCGRRGCKIGYDVYELPEVITGFRITATPLPETWEEKHTFVGTNSYAQKIIKDYPLESDGSVRAAVPCDTPIIMEGVDADGNVVARDEFMHSLRPGEDRFCYGCHDGHSTERYNEIDQNVQTMFAGTIAAGKDPVVPPESEWEDLTFTADIWPILQDNCVVCHTDFNTKQAAGRLVDGIMADHIGLDFPEYYQLTDFNVGTNPSIQTIRIVDGGSGYTAGEDLAFIGAGDLAAGRITSVDENGKILAVSIDVGGNNYTFSTEVTVPLSAGTGATMVGTTARVQMAPPQHSYWVNRFAKESLFYWKCMNQRMDGRTDELYELDMNFGPDHPTTATPEECATIARWIDTGAREAN